MLTDEQLLRYNRQLLLHDFDVAGQERLQAAAVLVVDAIPADLAAWGTPADRLAFISPPPRAAMRVADELLREILGEDVRLGQTSWIGDPDDRSERPRATSAALSSSP